MKLNFYNSLSLMFIYLKLTDVIDWSWWFILLPIYGSVFLKAVFENIIKQIKK